MEYNKFVNMCTNAGCSTDNFEYYTEFYNSVLSGSDNSLECRYRNTPYIYHSINRIIYMNIDLDYYTFTNKTNRYSRTWGTVIDIPNDAYVIGDCVRIMQAVMIVISRKHYRAGYLNIAFPMIVVGNEVNLSELSRCLMYIDNIAIFDAVLYSTLDCTEFATIEDAYNVYPALVRTDNFSFIDLVRAAVKSNSTCAMNSLRFIFNAMYGGGIGRSVNVASALFNDIVERVRLE